MRLFDAARDGGGYLPSKSGARAALVALGIWAGCAPASRRPGVPVAVEPCGERELVVLVHGLGRTPLSMLPMALALRREGYEVLNFSYSSYGPSVAEIGARLASAVRSRTPAGAPRRVHFVGHSLGNVVIRWTLEYDRPDATGRVVMLAPPNQGSEVANRLERGLSWLLAPLPELTTDSLSTVRRLPPPEGVEFAVLAGDRDGKVSVTETYLTGARDHRVVPSRHTFIMLRPSVVGMTSRFLRTGALGNSGGTGPLPCLAGRATGDGEEWANG
jgi:pimeloyl-ACP methyl ester carboxylesterase